jgi:hypothetical protein
MKKLIDIFIFTVFVVGGFFLANISAITFPLVLLLAVLLSILYWKTRRRVLAYLCGAYAIFLIIIPTYIAGLFLAGHQWDRIKEQHAGTRAEVESHIFLARTVRPSSFNGLYMSWFYTWNENAQTWNDLNGRVYAPADGDTFYSYKVLGYLPIDVIYDRNDNVKLAFNSFDF